MSTVLHFSQSQPQPRDPVCLDYDLVIVGGGLVGLTLAAALQHSKLKVLVVEAQPTSVAATKGQAYHINLLSSRIFAEIGVWSAMRPGVNPIREIHLSDSDYAGKVQFTPADLASEFLGYVAEHRVLLAALRHFLQNCTHVTYLCPAELVHTTYGADGVELTLITEGQTQAVRTQLLVAADGARSPIRQGAGIATAGWQYGQACVVAFIKPEKSHQDIAYERFQPEGPFAILPLPDNLCRIVWTVPKEEAVAIAQLDDAAFLSRLKPRYGDQMGELQLVGERFVFPVQLKHSLRYTQPRLALIGDAAHCCHPVGGQGVNLGFRDAAALAEVILSAHRQGEDLGDQRVLRRYEQWRKLENLTILGFTDLLNRLFSNSWMPVVWLRRIGLQALRHIPLTRSIALRLMVGLLGRRPQLGEVTVQP